MSEMVTQKTKRVYDALLALLMTGLSLLVFYQVLSRYLPFVPSFLWTEELARGFLIWLVMMGAGIGVFERTHFRMAVLGPNTNEMLKPAVALIVTGAGAYLTYSSITFTENGLGKSPTEN